MTIVRISVWTLFAITILLSCSKSFLTTQEIEELLTSWGNLAQKANEKDTIVVTGSEGWLFFGPELRHVGVGPFWGKAAADVSTARNRNSVDPLPAILDFYRQLQNIGIDLLIVPVPPKIIAYPDKLSSVAEFVQSATPSRFDIHHQTFYNLLRANGVRVLDLVPLFLTSRSHPNGILYCKQDTHWSGNATVLTAGEIVAELNRRSLFQVTQRNPFTHRWQTTEILGDLWNAANDPSIIKERLPLRFVETTLNGLIAPVDPDPSSPIVLLGDSHNLIFHAGKDMHARGAGLPDQLALELGFAVDLVAVRGSGATAARINLLRRAQKDPSYWNSKRLVIWCFSAREFTETDGWQNVPII